MKGTFYTLCLFILLFDFSSAKGQRLNGEIFIPMDNHSEIWLKPRLDTLNNNTDYEFKIRVSPEYKINQFLFEKGLAMQNDSVLVITPNSSKYGDMDTATLRVIVNSIGGGRIFLFQKQFIVRVPEKLFPVINKPKTNLVMVNDKTELERNQEYPKTMFADAGSGTFVALYDNEANMKRLDVNGVTVALFKKEGKQYISKGDTISTEALRELKKIKKPTPVYIRVEGQNGKSKKVVWNRIIVSSE